MFGVISRQFIFVTILFLGLWSNSYCYRFEPNTFTFNNLSECPGSENFSVHVNYNVVPVARNKFDMNGEILFGEFLGGKIDVGFFFLEKENRSKELSKDFFSFIAPNHHAKMRSQIVAL